MCQAEDKLYFTHTSYSVINNPNLSWTAKGVMMAILSFQEYNHGRISINDILRISKDEENFVLSAINELEDHGYLIKPH
jgi:hypothetical protein